MSPRPISVAILGTGPIADRLAARIDEGHDLRLTGRITTAQPVPEGTDCVVYAPTLAEITGDATKDVLALLREGHDVVSAIPLDGQVPIADIRDACRAGNSTFHATSAFQTALATRLVRSLSEVTRDIRRVELEEELDLPDAGVYPWKTLGDTGIGIEDIEAARSAVSAVAGFYEAGLRVLDEAVFAGAAETDATPAVSVQVLTTDAGIVEKVIVNRDFGPRLSYRSTWIARTGDGAPLRYRIVTATDTAKGSTTVQFHGADGLHPADHLTCVGILDALRPIHESDAGIAHRDLSITSLMSDDRLAT
ncbi:hypothetical protein [Nocardia sp. NPDC005366]|uniref:hypothetical protein n=1 Tax=Nocardia sp. NPDC005366 TaxID=3156878 RepID=UPI0033B03DD8